LVIRQVSPFVPQGASPANGCLELFGVQRTDRLVGALEHEVELRFGADEASLSNANGHGDTPEKREWLESIETCFRRERPVRSISVAKIKVAATGAAGKKVGKNRGGDAAGRGCDSSRPSREFGRCENPIGRSNWTTA
jgi:hypothetical protein